VFVKICGITNEEDAHYAVAMGADAVGFVFAPSPRQIVADRARDIVRRLAHGVVTVGVFRDETPQRVVEVVHQVGLRGAQLHGHESPAEVEFVRQRVPFVVKAFAAGDAFFDRVDDYDVDAVLIDSAQPGSGRVFDWSLAENLPLHRRVMLAGGLTPDNVGEAIERLHPWGVDVSTGVETAPGHKDAVKVMRFVNAAKGSSEDDPADPESIEIDDQGRPVLDLYDYEWEENAPQR
jgi:phosphoribosylanthranilate isomerase